MYIFRTFFWPKLNISIKLHVYFGLEIEDMSVFMDSLKDLHLWAWPAFQKRRFHPCGCYSKITWRYPFVKWNILFHSNHWDLHLFSRLFGCCAVDPFKVYVWLFIHNGWRNTKRSRSTECDSRCDATDGTSQFAFQKLDNQQKHQPRKPWIV